MLVVVVLLVLPWRRLTPLGWVPQGLPLPEQQGAAWQATLSVEESGAWREEWVSDLGSLFDYDYFGCDAHFLCAT
jgi:hypothetical protein